MNFRLDYETMMTALSDVSSVVEDSMSSEDMRNVILRITKDKDISVIGINQIITYKTQLKEGTFNLSFDEKDVFDDTGVMYMQIKNKELQGYLQTFRGMHKTKPTEISFTTKEHKVLLVVKELELTDNKELESRWVFDNIPVRPNIKPQLNMQADLDSLEMVDSNSILFYTANMLPIMSNEGQNNMYNLLAFGNDFVVAYNQAFNTLVQNHLPSAFDGISLNYRAISFMKNVICSVENVRVGRTQTHLVFETEKGLSFISYLTKMPNYKIFLESFKKEHAFVLDRQYFKDVLKRVSLINDAVSVEVKATEGIMKISNSKFNQDIPILNTKNMDSLGEVKFKILLSVLSKAIIGDDDKFSPTTFVYLVPNEKGGYTIIFSDDSGQWFSLASIR